MSQPAEMRETGGPGEADLVLAERERLPPGIDPKSFAAAVDYAARRYRVGVQHYERILTRIGFSGAERALDVGSGAGHWCIASARQNRLVEGVELRAEFVEVARRMTRHFGLEDRISYRVGAAEDASYPDAQFQLVCCHSVLMYVDHEPVLRNIARWTEPGGLFYCGYTTVGARLARAVRAVAPGNDGRVRPDLEVLISDALLRCGVRRRFGNRVRAFRREEILGMCEAVGFEFVDSPDVQDGPRAFLGQAGTFDCVCRRRPGDALSGLLEGRPSAGDRLRAARELIGVGCPAMALEALEGASADARDSEFAELYLRARLRCGQTIEAAANRELLQSLPPATRQLLTGMSRHVVGTLERALEAYAAIPEDHPDRSFLIATCLLGLQRYGEAHAEICGTGYSTRDPIRTWAVKTAATVGAHGDAAARPLVSELVELLEQIGTVPAEEAKRLLTDLGTSS